jgi:putative endonuclease
MTHLEAKWWVYILRTSRMALYTGITVDIERRLLQHNGVKPNGAKALRGQRPVTLVWKNGPLTHREALGMEREIKKLSKIKKEALVAG